MKTKKLLRKVKHMLGHERHRDIDPEALEKIVRKLKKKEASLKDHIEDEKDKTRRQELERKLEVVKAQRIKGAQLLNKLQDD